MGFHSGKGLTQVVDNCFMHTDAENRPRYLVGVIHRQDTRGRGEAPACLCGFDTGLTPFAKGHVMALELGGCDESFNIVPQYEQWQGGQDGVSGGAWRDMEVSLRHAAHEVMVVEIDYDVVNDDYGVNKLAFGGGEFLLHWTSPKIPTRFRVWGLDRDDIADYLDGTRAQKENGIAALILERHAEVALFDAHINEMPRADRRFWQANMVRKASRLAHTVYEDAATAALNLAVAAAVAAAHGPPAGGGGGPMRRQSHRGAIARHKANPVAVPLPPVPLDYARWIGTNAARTTVVNHIANNTNNASPGWTPVERNVFDIAAVIRACG